MEFDKYQGLTFKLDQDYIVLDVMDGVIVPEHHALEFLVYESNKIFGDRHDVTKLYFEGSSIVIHFDDDDQDRVTFTRATLAVNDGRYVNV
jgi:hypothetical protein